jgi:hypothetical protein
MDAIDPYYLKDERKFLPWRPLFLALAGTLKAQPHLLGTQGAMPNNDAANRQARKDWIKGHEQAILILIKFIPTLQYVMTRAPQAVPDAVNGPTSAERWAALCAHCNVVDGNHVNGLRETLEQTCHNPGDKVGVTIAKLADIITECRETGDPSLTFTDNDIATRLLRIVGRNSDWSAVTETILACESAANPITLNSVETRLKSLQTQRDARPKSNSGANAGAGGAGGGDASTVLALWAKIETMVDKKLSDRNSGTRNDKGIMRCYNCNRDGHKSTECKQPCGRKLNDGTKCGGIDHTSATCTNAQRKNK